MTPEDIEKEIAGGQIAAISLDTSAFGNPNEMSLEYGHLRRMEQFKGSGVRFILSDVVAQEVSVHIEKGALEAQAQLDKVMKLVGNSWNVDKATRAEAKNVLLGEETPSELSRRRLELFVDRTGCDIIKAEEHARIEELVQRYFSHAAPFGDKETKKHEFPDALALLTLESWATEANTKVLVVSNDDDWIWYCSESEHLVAVRQLGEALGFFHKDAGIICKMLSHRLKGGEYPEFETAIRDAIENHIENMYFIPEASSNYYFEDEVAEVALSDFSIVENGGELSPLDMSKDYLVAEIPVNVDVDITCNFSFSVKDWVDKDYVPMGTTSVTITETLELTVIITFVGNIPDSPSIDEIEVDGGNRYYIGFGEVEPDWMSEPESYEE